MMRECDVHGYYRAEICNDSDEACKDRDEGCPICGEMGKFMMNDFEMERIGRLMAGILRHGRFDPDMDEQGFVDLREMVSAIQGSNSRMHWLRPHHIIALIETDPKGRYQISGDMVRATYGHTIDLDLNLPSDDIPEVLFYPTTPEESGIILETGLIPSDRTMVHLSLTYNDAFSAGSVRVSFPTILVIDTAKCASAGHEIGKAARTVFLCRHVPADCLKIAHEEEYSV
jgi:putative RNA 2'-phosphotransferase